MNPREHGSQRGYDQHKQYKEEQCSACRFAHSQYNAQRRKLGHPTGRIELAAEVRWLIRFDRVS